MFWVEELSVMWAWFKPITTTDHNRMENPYRSRFSEPFDFYQLYCFDSMQTPRV